MFKFVVSALMVMGSFAFANEHEQAAPVAPATTETAAPAAAGQEATDMGAKKAAPAKAKKATKKAEKTEGHGH